MGGVFGGVFKSQSFLSAAALFSVVVSLIQSRTWNIDMLRLLLYTCHRHFLSTLFSLRRTRNILDDFREAYYWLRQNTDEHARVMSWWDYGYQIAGMANRTTLVDNNTWNNSHIALVSLLELHSSFRWNPTRSFFPLSRPFSMFVGGESHVFQRECSLRHHEVPGRGLRPHHLWGRDRLLWRRY